MKTNSSAFVVRIRSPVKFWLAAAITMFSVNAVHFDCFYVHDRYGDLGLSYVCYATVTLNESTRLENVTGNHINGKTTDDVDYLQIWNQDLPFFPEGIENYFKILKALVIVESGLLSLSASDLEPFPKLVFLNLWRNKLVSIDGNLFEFTPLLASVDLNSNQIEHIGHDLVTHLDYLKTLDLTANPCISKDFISREQILEFSSQLSIYCPPLLITSTLPITTTADTPGEECSCVKEIDELLWTNLVLGTRINSLQESNTALNLENQQQNEEIGSLKISRDEQQLTIDQLLKTNEKLMELNAAFEDRLLEVETKLRELHSLPCANENRK